MSEISKTYPTWNVDTAEYLARAMHTGQVDKAGRKYIQHPLRVVGHVTEHPAYQSLSKADQEIAVMVAWLHDVIEDTSMTLNIMSELGCPSEVLWRVERLSRYPHQSSENYYAGIKVDPIALIVKACDIADNTNPHRLAALDEDVAARLEVKYAKAKVALGIPV